MIVDRLKSSILKSLIENGISKIEPEKIEFEKCITNFSSKNYQIKQSEIYQNGLFPVVSQSQRLIEGYSNEKDKLFHHDTPVLVYGDHSNTIKYIDFDFIVGADGTKIFSCNSGFDLKYLYYNIMYNLINIPISGYSRHYKYLKKTQIYYYPIEEQHKIVNKIEELFEKLHEIEPIECDINRLKMNFSTKFKKSIIQNACNGNFSSQFKSESVEDIIECLKKQNNRIKLVFKSTPFQIPNNWAWIRFGDLVDFNIGKTPTRSELTFWGDDYNWISISDMIDDGYINETKECVSKKAFDDIFKGNISKKGTLIMSFKLTVGKCSILNIDAFHNEGIISIYPKYDSEILKNYLMKILPFMTKYGDTKGAIKGNTLNSKSLKELLIPLPPIEEQKRIVDKIEELLPLLKDVDNIVNS